MLSLNLNPRISIRARLAWVIGTLALATALLLSFLVGKESTGQVRADKGTLMAEMAYQMSERMEERMHTRSHQIQIFASLSTIRDPRVPLEEKRVLLEQLKQSFKDYAWIGMTDAQGNILVGTSHLLEGKNVAKRDWFIFGSQGPHAGDVHDAFLLAKLLPKPNDPLGLRLVDVSAPIRDHDGKLLGVICGHLSWDWAIQVRDMLLEPLKQHGKVDVLVLNKEGKILLGTPDLHTLKESLALPSVKLAQEGKNGYLVETWADGGSYLTGYSLGKGYQDYPGLGWVILVRQPAAAAFRTADRLQLQTFLIGAVFATLFVVLTWLIVGKIVRPLTAITKAADRIRIGETTAQIPLLDSQDETGVLSRSLYQLVTTLDSQNRELANLNDQLNLAAKVFESSSEGIIITDAANTILAVNRAFAEITGYSEMDVLGKTPVFLKSGRHDRDFYHSMWTALLEKGRWQGEIWNRRKDGSIYPEWLIISIIRDEKGNIANHIGVFIDISEQKKAEGALKELNDTLEQRVDEEIARNREKDHILIQQSRLAAMGEMIHNIAHQWRQPLNAVGLLISNIKDAYQYNELTAEYLEKAETDAKRLLQSMSSTIDDFRDFFKPGKTSTTFSMQHKVEQALSLMSANLEHNHIATEITIDQDCLVTGFPNEFSQVVLNILSNAKDAILEHGIPHGRIELRVYKADNQGVVRIKDNGGGIPEHVLGKVFDPYFTTKESGTGIGLYMSKMILDSMNGRIEVRNLDDGAEVSVFLLMQEPTP